MCGIVRHGGPISVLPYVVFTLHPSRTSFSNKIGERAAPPGCKTLSCVRGVKSRPGVSWIYSYRSSMTAGAQCKQSTGDPMDSSSRQADRMAPGAGGQLVGGNVSARPLGRPLNAIDIPAIWNLFKISVSSNTAKQNSLTAERQGTNC